MLTKYKGFDAFVICFVILVGGVFGSITGAVYRVGHEGTLWIAGTIAGLICSYPLAKSFLRSLVRISDNATSGVATCIGGAVAGAGYGAICTIVVHVTMIYIFGFNKSVLVLLLIGEIVGASAGLVAGLICSLLYVSLEKGRKHENSRLDQPGASVFEVRR